MSNILPVTQQDVSLYQQKIEEDKIFKCLHSANRISNYTFGILSAGTVVFLVAVEYSDGAIENINDLFEFFQICSGPILCSLTHLMQAQVNDQSSRGFVTLASSMQVGRILQLLVPWPNNTALIFEALTTTDRVLHLKDLLLNLGHKNMLGRIWCWLLPNDKSD